MGDKMLLMTLKFPDWINKMFVNWQAEQGRKKSIQDFANYVGVSRPLMNMWMNGNQTPGKGNIEMLANIFGNEVYDSLNLPRPNPYLQTAVNNWEFMSEEKQEKISRMIAEEAAKYEAKKSADGVQKIPKRGKIGACSDWIY